MCCTYRSSETSVTALLLFKGHQDLQRAELVTGTISSTVWLYHSKSLLAVHNFMSVKAAVRVSSCAALLPPQQCTAAALGASLVLNLPTLWVWPPHLDLISEECEPLKTCEEVIAECLKQSVSLRRLQTDGQPGQLNQFTLSFDYSWERQDSWNTCILWKSLCSCQEKRQTMTG